ncbi:MAG: DUF4091 domain-containing protein [Oscillospiraceae bacterium]|jgi:hypothetical protein|nr:DUF4091 domain-containing protein [Oscillospiraceae bacterium]
MQTHTLWRGDTLDLPVTFTLPAGADFSAAVQSTGDAAARLFWRKPVRAFIGRGFDKSPNAAWNNEALKEDAPDILWETLPTSVPADGVVRLWLRLSVSTDAQPGDYTVTVTCGDAAQTVPFLVLDQLLPGEGFSLELWQYPYTVARYYGIEQAALFGERHCAILREQLRPYREAGGRILTATICEDPWNSQTYDPYPSMIKWTRHADGTLAFDYSHFDAWVLLGTACGLDGAIKCFSPLPWENKVRYFDASQGKNVTVALKPGSAAWKSTWRTFLTDFVAHLRGTGWLPRTYLALDERPRCVMRHLLRLLKKFPELKTSCAVNFAHPSARLLRQLDDVSVVQKEVPENGTRWQKFIATRRAAGQLTTLYTCAGDYPNSFARSQPEESAWTILYALAKGADGFLRWAYDAWMADPLTDISYHYWESGDPLLVYPGDKTAAVPVPRESVRLAMLAQGVRTAKKLRWLLDNADDATHAQIRQSLAALRRPEGKVNAHGAMESNEQFTMNNYF